MSEKRWAYFDATGEILLEFMKKISDLPEDAKLMKIEIAPSDMTATKYSSFNKVRLFMESESFDPLPEGGNIVRLDPECRYDKWVKKCE